jgi:uncharacterized protein
MSDVASKPIPEPTPETAEYWAGAARQELMIQRCTQCGRHQFPPRMLCTACSSRELEWVRARGLAAVRSFTVVRRPVSEAFAEDVPYVVALVVLDEGPTLMTNIIGCKTEELRIGMRVTVCFDNRTPSCSIPQFAPSV